jgi:hypothetical protein
MQRDRAAFVLAAGRRIFVKRQDDMTARDLHGAAANYRICE